MKRKNCMKRMRRMGIYKSLPVALTLAVAIGSAVPAMPVMAAGTEMATAEAVTAEAATVETYLESDEIILDANEVAIQELIARMYENVLGRAPETAGMDYWMKQLLSGSSDGANMGNEFVTGPEYQSAYHTNEEYIRTLYLTFLNREPAAEEITYWTNQIWSKSRAYVLSGFVMSDEFSAICESFGILRGYIAEDGTVANSGIGQFVSRLYKVVLDRDGEAAGMNYWTKMIATKEWEAEDVATEGFFHSNEFLAKNMQDSAFLDVLYGTFFGRAADEGGKKYWLNELKSGKTRDEVITGFAHSDEFVAILHSYGLEPKPVPVVYPGPVTENTESWATIEADVTLRGAGSGYHAKLIIGNATSAVSFGIQYDVAASNGHANRAMCMIENIESNDPGGQSYYWPNDVEVELGKPAHLMLTMNKDGSGSVYVNYEKIGEYQNYSLANSTVYLRVEGAARLEGDQINADFNNIKLKNYGTYYADTNWKYHEFRTNKTMIATIKDVHNINIAGYISGIGSSDWDSNYGGVSSVVQFNDK